LTGQVTATFTLAGLDRTGPVNVARIRGQVEGKVTVNDPYVRGLGMVSGAQDIEWLLEQRRVLRASGTITLDALGAFRADVTKAFESSVRLKRKTTFSMTPLAASDLPPITVPEKARIAPGAGDWPHHPQHPV
jgi:hypothetical protein